MKRNKKHFFLALAVAFCAALSFCVCSSSTAATYTVDEAYVYPIVPGTDAWKNLDSLDAKIAVCQVDEDLLNAMTTPALVETVLTYPLLPNMYAFNTVEDGLRSVASYFPGIDILFAREDSAECLAAYQTSKQTRSKTVPAIVDVNTKILKELLEPNITPSITKEENSIDLQYIVANVKTPNGSVVEAYYNSTWDDYDNFTREDALDAHEYYLELYPNMTVLSGISPAYNCHSYAWYNNTTSNKYWIPSPDLYMTDGSYTQKNAPAVGYKVNWTYAGHSAIVQNMSGGIQNPTVRSKWGTLGLYIHSLLDCPYSQDISRTVTYWTR